MFSRTTILFTLPLQGVGSNDQHNAYDADVANSFYNLATEFYEYGWGDSFHFGYRAAHEPHSKAIANSQHFVAQKLNVKDMDRVLDMGCGAVRPPAAAQIASFRAQRSKLNPPRESEKSLATATSAPGTRNCAMVF